MDIAVTTIAWELKRFMKFTTILALLYCQWLPVLCQFGVDAWQCKGRPNPLESTFE